MSCLKCGGTGWLANFEPCDCGITQAIAVPAYISVPAQYQDVRFDSRLLPKDLHVSYGEYMDRLLRDCTMDVGSYHKNVLVCSPPNSGKSVFAYTVNSILYAKGLLVADLMDILEIRDVLLDIYGRHAEELEVINDAVILFVKIPLDLPNKVAETMSTLVERRVRKGHSTIFLYGGSDSDLKAQDRFGTLWSLLGDGSYNSIEIKSWSRKKETATESEEGEKL